jgi:GNAT superfamily N-acetyltransferase
LFRIYLSTMADADVRPRISNTSTGSRDEDGSKSDDKGTCSQHPTGPSSAAQCIQLCLLIDHHTNKHSSGAGTSPAGGRTRSGGGSPTAKTVTLNKDDNNVNNKEYSFDPVYTHQCFPGETIRGYQPAKGSTDNAYDNAILAIKSTETAAATDTTGATPNCKDIQITVHLAPSGRTCRVDIDITNPHKKRKRERKVDSLMSGGERQKKLRSRTSVSEHTKENKKNEDNEGDDKKIASGESSEEYESTEEEDEEEEEEEGDGSDDSSYTLNSGDDGDDSVDQEEDYDNDDDNENNNYHNEVTEGVTRKRRMPVAEIRERLKTALPTITDDSISTLKQDYLRRPIGTVLKEYSDQDDQNNTFCLSLATGEKAAPYHEQVQRLALLFIETADEVDVADETAGFWKVLYLFQKHSATKYSLAGYLTLFHFTAPFRKPVAGTVARICQVLLLPPYQRSGHGQVMLQAVADLAHGVYATPPTRQQSPSKKELKGYAESLVEVNVEDPAPGFTALRNRVDYVRFRQHHNCMDSDTDDNEGCREPWIDCLPVTFSTSNASKVINFLTPLTDAQITEGATRAKITARQIQIVYEVWQLDCLQRHTAAAAKDNTMDNSQDLEKMYRLSVKKRLNKAHREELGACRNKDEMKVALAELYDETLQGYQAILTSLQRQRERARK